MTESTWLTACPEILVDTALSTWLVAVRAARREGKKPRSEAAQAEPERRAAPAPPADPTAPPRS